MYDEVLIDLTKEIGLEFIASPITFPKTIAILHYEKKASLLDIVSQVLKTFHSQGVADVVMKGLVDVADQFAASINDTNFNSKGEKTND